MTREETIDKILDELLDDFIKVDLPLMEGMTLFAKVQNAVNYIKTLSADNCEDCISRQAVIAAIRNQYPGIPLVDFNGARRKWAKKYAQYRECEKIIESFPIVQPIRSKGEWKNSKCSVCGSAQPFTYEYHTYSRTMATILEHWNFCPNCGSKMKGLMEDE